MNDIGCDSRDSELVNGDAAERVSRGCDQGGAERVDGGCGQGGAEGVTDGRHKAHFRPRLFNPAGCWPGVWTQCPLQVRVHESGHDFG